MAKDGDIDLTVWVQSSESPLNSDSSNGDSPRGGFGDLTIIENSNGDNENGDDGGEEEEDEESRAAEGGKILEKYLHTYSGSGDADGGGGGGARGGGITGDDVEAAASADNELLHRLAGRHDDFLSTVKLRYRFSCITELDQSEQCAEPAIIRETTHCTCWPCDVVGDLWLKVKVYVAKRCKLACCQEYAWPQEWARRRRFCISKAYYLRLTDVTTREQDAILRWADLVASQEWREGNWTDRGVLNMADATKFRTQRVAWSIMEEHLAVLAYSQNKELVFLAARICIESLAKNKAMYTHSQQYWGFARIFTDLLRSPYDHVTEGLLMALQLYLRTLKIFHSCFSHKCTEYASAGLFPVLLDALEKRTPGVQAVAANILLLMAMHPPYITLISNIGGLNVLLKLTGTDHPLLKARVYACLEIVAKHEPAGERLVQEGILPLAVRGLAAQSPPGLQLSCLFLLNSLCRERRTLTKALAVDNFSVVKSCMRILTDWTLHISGASQSNRSLSPSIIQVQKWCTIPRQSLTLLCKLCVDELACKQLVKRGLVLKLRGVWFTWDLDRGLVMEALAVLARWPRAGDKICREGFLPILAEAAQGKEHVEHVLDIVLSLGTRHLSDMLQAGLLANLIQSFGRREFCRGQHPTVLSILATFSSNDQVRRLLLADDGRAYTLVLEVAVSASDFPLLQACIAVLSKMGTQIVPEPLLKTNCVLLVAYIDKLLKTGPDGLVLHGLMQLQDYLKVALLAKAFREHHCQRVVEILAAAPYKPPVRYMAGQVLQMLTGVRSRRASVKDDPPPVSGGAREDEGAEAESWQHVQQDSEEDEDEEGEEEKASLLHGTGSPKKKLLLEQKGGPLLSECQHQPKQGESKSRDPEEGASRDGERKREPAQKEEGPTKGDHDEKLSRDPELMAVAERLVTSAFADATTTQRWRSPAGGDETRNRDDDNRDGDDAAVYTIEHDVGEIIDDTDEQSDVDVDVGVQVNIIDATDDDNSSYYDDNNNNNNNGGDDDDTDDDFEIISVNDHDYVNI